MKSKKFRLRLLLATIYRKIKILKLNLLGYSFHFSVIIERGVKLDKLNKRGIFIGKNTLIASGTTILSHDHCKRDINDNPLFIDTKIGSNCFIAVNTTILPGVEIGNQCIIGAGSVVTKNIPSNSVAVGNPAKIIRNNIRMNDFAALENWNEKFGGWID